MYKTSARYYDAIYSWKDYAEESKRLDDLIQLSKPGARTLLDVACGTGHHLQLLSNTYKCEGLDLSEEMLSVARKRLPNIKFHQGSMFDFELRKQFDAVVCLFSSIGYAQSVGQLQTGIANMARHLAPNGVLVIEPWFKPEEWQAGMVHAGFVDETDLKIARMNVSKRDGDFAVMHMHHLVGTPEGIDYFVEDHRMRLFTHEQYLEAFETAELQTSHEQEGLMGRGLYIGVRR